MSDPAQFIPVGGLETYNQLLTGGEFILESLHDLTPARRLLSMALNAESDESIEHRCVSPKEGWGALKARYGPQTAGAKSSVCRWLNSWSIAQGSNSIQEMSRTEDFAD